jgi:hypothetical protein
MVQICSDDSMSKITFGLPEQKFIYFKRIKLISNAGSDI